MITKEQYLAATNKYKENKFSKFMLDKFLRDKTYNNYKLFIIIEFIVLNFLSAVMLVNGNKQLAITLTLIGVGIFFLFGFLLLTAAFINMYRTKKLCKELNCDVQELNNYYNIYN